MHNNYFKAALCALSISLAWNFPGSVLCAALGWLGAIAAVWLFNSPGPKYLPTYLMGIALNCLGMHWLFHTISYFGGFSFLPTFLIFALWATVSALQFVLLVYIKNCLPEFFSKTALATASAWTLSEFISLRIFPWHLGHTQLAFVTFAQIADLVGSLGISFFMLWFADALFKVLFHKSRHQSLALPILLFPLAFIYGHSRISLYSGNNFPTQEVALIQADITVEEKHNQRFFQQNTERYLKLTQSITKPNVLAVWPEAVIQEFIYDGLGLAQRDQRLPFRPDGTLSLLIGSLTFNAMREIHNSALAIFPDGTMPRPYHKQILMPFGEYTPLLKFFPWLAQIHSTPEFAAGQQIEVFEYPAATDAVAGAKIAALICYEDIVPSLSRAAVERGANLLANLTNDAWFGDTVAPYQHNLIASFRAIENRRYLIRSTNSGLTAIINPLGQTEASLPVFSEGVIESKVALISDKTFYNQCFMEWPWWSLLGLVALIILARLVSAKLAWPGE